MTWTIRICLPRSEFKGLQCRVCLSRTNVNNASRAESAINNFESGQIAKWTAMDTHLFELRVLLAYGSSIFCGVNLCSKLAGLTLFLRICSRALGTSNTCRNRDGPDSRPTCHLQISRDKTLLYNERVAGNRDQAQLWEQQRIVLRSLERNKWSREVAGGAVCSNSWGRQEIS